MTDTIELSPPSGREDAAETKATSHAKPPAEAKKAKLVRKAVAFAKEVLDTEDQATAERIIGAYYEHVPPADVIGRSPRDLSGAALSLWHFAERRRPGQAKIRVYNPELAADGWSSAHTIVEIVNDDMPFLVDSVTGAINAGDRVVHLVVHPILAVERLPGGRLHEIGKTAAAGSARIVDAHRDHP